MLNAVMSVLDGFENTKRVVEEKLCANLVFVGIEIDISRRLIYRGRVKLRLHLLSLKSCIYWHEIREKYLVRSKYMTLYGKNPISVIIIS